MNKTVLIIGSAHLCSKCVTDTLSGKPYVLAADGGLDRCIRLGILPDLLVGDMDSAKTGWDKFVREHNIPVIRHPVRKDKSDLELAIEEALKITPGEIVLSGVIGGRTDHTLFNLQLLHTILDEGVPCRIVTCREEITPARSPHTINAPPGNSGITGALQQGNRRHFGGVLISPGQPGPKARNVPGAFKHNHLTPRPDNLPGRQAAGNCQQARR